MASPYVAAVAAVLHSQDRDPDQVMEAIRATAKNPDSNAELGLGIVDATAAVQSKK